jgi:DNA invertase Pin-like site-specific DNA recombinase
MPKRVALYLRVSTTGQTVENQQRELETVAEQRGWEIVEVYSDEGISGSKGRDKRPAFNELCQDATRGKFKLIMSWSVDRLGRSLQDLVGFINELEAVGCGLYLHQQAVDTSTPSGKAMFAMCGVFAEFERAMIQERVHAGLNRARAQGKTLGRPKTSDKKEAQIIQLRGQGKGIRKIATEVGCGVSVVQRVVASM